MRVLLCIIITFFLAAAALRESPYESPSVKSHNSKRLFKSWFEAEDGQYNGVIFALDGSDFSGRGYVTGFQGQNTLNVQMPTIPGPYNINMRFRSPFGPKTCTIQINGASIGDVQLPQTDGWQEIFLGKANLGDFDTLTVVSGWGWYDVDNIQIASLAAQNNIRVEAEEGGYGGVTLGVDGSDFTGRGYVTNFMNQNFLNVGVGSTPGPYDILIRYRSPWGAKVMSLQLNGQAVGDIQLPQSAGWQQISAGRVVLQGWDTVTVVSNWGYYDIDNIEFKPFVSTNSNLNRNPVDPWITPQARGLFNYLQTNFGQKMLSGQQGLSYANWAETATGRAPAILGCDFMDYSPSRVEHGATSTQVEDAITWDSRGGIVTFVWHWNAPTCVYDDSVHPWYRGFYTDNTCFDLAEALAEGESGPNYQLLLRDIDAIGVQLRRLQDAGVPVLFRPLHEAEGGWFWWGSKGPDAAKQLYRLLYQRITWSGIHNIVWVWNSVSPDWYVGNDFCDIVSVDSYPQGADHSPQTSYWQLLTTLTGGTKLIAMAENGPIPDPGQSISLGASWSYFCTWAGDFLTAGTSNAPDYLSGVYNSDLVVTLDELGAWKNSK